YPLLIHRQATGGGGFEQPIVSDPGLPPLLQLFSLDPLIVAPAAGVGQLTNLFLPRPYDNMGVPGMTVGDVVRTRTDNGQGLFDAILRGLGTQLEQAVALQPTFVTLWIGNNDVLAAATSGLVIDGVTLTRLADFERDYRTITDTLTGIGADLALATIPSVTSIPFVTTIPPYLAQDPVSGSLIFAIGPNGQPLTIGDFVLLSASSLLAQGIGVPIALGGTGLPLPDTAVLSASEAATIAARVDQYNNVIRTIAAETGAALMDANVIFSGIVRDGLNFGGIEYTSEYISGGIFSYDGVHPTPFGYAVIAGEFVSAINATYGADIAPPSLFPFVFGDAGSAPQILPTGEVIFSNQAYSNLVWALGLEATRPAPPPVPGPVAGPVAQPVPVPEPGAGPVGPGRGGEVMSGGDVGGRLEGRQDGRARTMMR
ncbi:MAG: hypothetical protein KDB62_10495, partial [Solirubrobacterales bacterium]|nr:hypothetical protein [Solirubrobacterales bacterium]